MDDYSNKNLSYIDYVEKENNPDGNCFFRTIGYYFREYEEYYLDFWKLLYELLSENKDKYIDIVPKEVSHLIIKLMKHLLKQLICFLLTTIIFSFYIKEIIYLNITTILLKEIKNEMKDRINKKPLLKNLNENKKIGIYVEYDRNNYPEKYNDITEYLLIHFLFLIDTNLKINQKKRTLFRKRTRENFLIKEERLFYKYKI